MYRRDFLLDCMYERIAKDLNFPILTFNEEILLLDCIYERIAKDLNFVVVIFLQYYFRIDDEEIYYGLVYDIYYREINIIPRNEQGIP